MDWQQDYERKQITLDQVFEEHLTGTTSTSNKLFDKNTASSSHNSPQETKQKIYLGGLHVVIEKPPKAQHPSIEQE